MPVDIEGLKRLKAQKKKLNHFLVKELPIWLKWATTWDIISDDEIPSNISIAGLVFQGYIIPINWNIIDKEKITEYKKQRAFEIIDELNKEIQILQKEKEMLFNLQDTINYNIEEVKLYFNK